MPQKRKDLKIKDSNLWYLIGLITSDGCLSSDGRHIDITSKNHSFLVGLVEELELPNRVTFKDNGRKKKAYHIQIANKNFYDFLLSIGLTPNKSLTLKNLNIPKIFFRDFLRGLIDGDGSVCSWIHPANLHEQWSLRIYSGSQAFLMWLRFEIEKYTGCKGRLHAEVRPKRDRFVYTLKYGKMTAKKILQTCYYQGVFGLDKKVKLATSCSKALSGWCRSKTLIEIR
ncbi:MAG: LAGLIDADG family homing endonuclease [Candidatus Omnitrophota bacterium]